MELVRSSRNPGVVDRSSVVRPVALFAVAGLVVAAVVAIGSVVVSRRAATDDAVRGARRDAQLIARTAIEPTLDNGILAERPASLTAIDREVRGRVLDDRLVRVKIWDSTGRILYSDQRQLVGSRYALGADERAALASGAVTADVSDLSRPENRYDRKFRKLLEVYLPVRTPDGHSVLFEAYFRYDTVTSAANRIWSTFLPILIGSLLVLELVQIPLAWSLARRLRAGQDRQHELLRRAIESSELERRRIASDLHDGVVQDLAAVSYALASVHDDDAERAEVLAEAAANTRRSIRSLRTLLVDIYPQNLRDEGLRAALSDLTAPLATRGIDAVVDLPDNLRFPADVEALLFRAAQEALRNVTSHAQARRVDVVLTRPDHRAVLDVTDDGVGFTPRADGPQTDGHVGLRVLGDLVHDSGGHLEVRSEPGKGTTVHVEIPTR